MNALRQKKFPGRLFSFKLLYVRSRTSSAGKAPKPRGNALSLFILHQQNNTCTQMYNKKGKSKNIYRL